MVRVSSLLVVGALVVGLTACEQSETGRSAGKESTTQPAPEEGISLDDVKRKAQDTLAATAELARRVRERYQEDAQRKLSEFDEHLRRLKKKLDDAAEEARPELEKRIKQLAQKAKAARETLEKLAGASDEAWEEAKKGLDKAVDELKEAMEETGADTQPATRPAQPHGDAPPGRP